MEAKMQMMSLRRSRAMELLAGAKRSGVNSLTAPPPPRETESKLNARESRIQMRKRVAVLKPVQPLKPISRLTALAMIKSKIPDLKRSRNVTLVKWNTLTINFA